MNRRHEDITDIEPWDPIAYRRGSDAETRRWSITLEVNGRRTFTSHSLAPPSYIHVIENPQDYPISKSTVEGNNDGLDESDENEEEEPPPTYRHAIVRYPEVRQEFLNRTMNPATDL